MCALAIGLGLKSEVRMVRQGWAGYLWCGVKGREKELTTQHRKMKVEKMHSIQPRLESHVVDGMSSPAKMNGIIPGEHSMVDLTYTPTRRR